MLFLSVPIIKTIFTYLSLPVGQANQLVLENQVGPEDLGVPVLPLAQWEANLHRDHPECLLTRENYPVSALVWG